MSVQHKDWYTSTDVGVRIENSNGPVVTTDEVAVEITGTQAHKSFKSLTDALEEKVDIGADVTNVVYDQTNKKIVAYKESTPTDVVTVAKIKEDLNLTKSDVGLGNVDNTADSEKDVNSAAKDGDGNVITETYETIAQAGASHTTLQGNIDAVSAIVQNLTGLEGTNFGGFSLDAVEATAISNIATIYTNAGYTSGDLYWFLAGTDMSALKAYRYDGSGSPVAISSTVYDFTDFSGLQTQVSSYRGNTNDLDSLNTLASAGTYQYISGSKMGLVSVSYDTAHSSATQIWLSDVIPDEADPTIWNEGPAILMRTYKNSAWSAWQNPIAKNAADIAALGPKIGEDVELTLTIERGAISSSNGSDSSSTTRLRTNGYVEHPNIKIEITSGKYYVFGYDADGFVGADSVGWRTETATISLSGCTKYRIVFSFDDNATIDTSDFPTLGVNVYWVDKSKKTVVLISDVVDNLTTGGTKVPLSAEQGKVLAEKINPVTDVDIEQYELSKYSLNSDGTWHLNSTPAQVSRSRFIPIEAGKKYRISTTNASTYAILKDAVAANGATANFSENYPQRYSIDAGSIFEFVCPNDATCCYLNQVATAGATGTGISLIESPLNDIEAIKELVYDYKKEIDISAIPESVYTIYTNNRWTTMSKGRSKLVPITTGKKYAIYTDIATIVAILTSSEKDSVHFSAAYNSRIEVTPDSGFTFVAPADALYAYLLVRNNSLAYTGVSISQTMDVKEKIASIETKSGNATTAINTSSQMRVAKSVGNPLTPLTIPIDANGEELPTTREVLNVQKKSAQMTDIEWTPLLDIPYQGTGDKFSAGETITGLPYSSVKEIDKYIGFDVSIHTFMTAVKNPYSLLYTECVKASRTASAWNFVYHGVDDCCAYFGTVCSVLTGYATGQRVQWSTGEDKWCSEVNLNMVKVYDQSAQGLRIGDIYWKSGHNRLILGLKRDSNGNVTHVQVSESTGKFVRARDFVTAASFESTMQSESAIIYRNIELYKNRYTPSEFIAVGDEVITPYSYNDDICTFAGDKATFAVGNLVVVNYNLDSTKTYGWTAIEVYKDDVLIGTYTLSEAEQSLADFYASEGEPGTPYTPSPYNQGLSESGHALVLGKALAAGQYKARMTDGTNTSDYTYWEVVQTDMSFSKDESGTCRISWESFNGKPLSFTICSNNGTVYAHNELEQEDVDAGYIDINLVRLNAQQYPNRPFTDNMYLKVHFEGQYGRVTNEPIEVALSIQSPI